MKKLSILFLLLTCCFLAVKVSAKTLDFKQSTVFNALDAPLTGARIAGNIRDLEGAAAYGIKVTLRDGSIEGVILTTYTDVYGDYHFSNVMKGEYELEFLQGFSAYDAVSPGNWFWYIPLAYRSEYYTDEPFAYKY